MANSLSPNPSFQDDTDESITESVPNLFQSSANTSYYSSSDSYTLGKSETGKSSHTCDRPFTYIKSVI